MSQFANSPRTPEPTRADRTASVSLELSTIGFAEPEVKLSPIPSALEQDRYRNLSRLLNLGSALSSSQFAEIVRTALGLRSRLSGLSTSGAIGGIAQSELRCGWAKQATDTWTELVPLVEALYRQPAPVVVNTVVHDFLQRLKTRMVRLSDPQSASTISSCLEQSRLMFVFAGRALKSEDHAQSALGGLKEKSFASGAASEPAGKGEKSGADRQAAFTARQEQKAAAAAAKREALKSGGALPVKGAAPKPPPDDEKSELLAATAAVHTALFESAKPTEEQKRLLEQRPPKELEHRLATRLTQPPGPGRSTELELTRTELVNVIATRIKDWLSAELQLAKHAEKEALEAVDLPRTPQAAMDRLAEAMKEHAGLRALTSTLESDLKRLAQSAAKAPQVAQKVLSAEERKALDVILNPPKEKETFELAD